mmetsp:Transcript_36975/g.66521  ORF Transcript_36975/g.66521 Transcript_36975/m.66521 type:complete len:287 (+) Transcript_36975:183-1043(+)
MRAKRWIPRQYHIGKQHHLIRQILLHTRALVDKLSIAWSWPQFCRTLIIEPCVSMTYQPPFILNHIGSVFIGEFCHVIDPWTGIARRIGMASSIYMSPTQKGDDFLIIESHAVEYLVTDVGAESFPSLHLATGIEAGGDVGIIEVRAAILFRGGQTSIRHIVRKVRIVQVIDPTRLEFEDRSTSILQSHIRRQYPQIRIRNLRKLTLYGFKKRTRHAQSGILGIGRLVFESHSGAVGSTRSRRGVECAAGMPCEADEDGCETSVVPGGIVHEELEFGADGVVSYYC